MADFGIDSSPIKRVTLVDNAGTPVYESASGGGVVTGNVASGAADSGNPVKVGGVYNSTQPTFTDGQRGDIQLTTRGVVKASLYLNDSVTAFVPRADNADGTAVSATANNFGVLNRNTVYNGTSWDRQYSGGVTGMAGVNPQATPTGAASFLNIAAGQATTTVKSGAGTLYAIVLNSAATATNTTTVYDNTAASGTVIGRPAATTATVPTTLNYGPVGLAFATGLTIITATANGSDMTVIYK